MRQKTLALLALIAILLMMAFALNMSVAETQKPPEVPRISFLVRESDIGNVTAMRQGAMLAANEFILDLHFTMLTNANDAQEQIAQIAREIEGGAQAVILSAANEEALTPIVQSLIVPVVMVESGVENVASTLSADDQLMGYHLAKQMVEQGVQNQQIVIVRMPQDKRSYVAERLQGLHTYLQEHGNVITQIEMTTETVYNPDALRTAISQANADTVIAFDLPQLTQIAAALEDVCPVYGFGSNSRALELLERGAISALAVPNDFSIGYQAAREAGALVNNPSRTPGYTAVGYHVVTAETMYDPENEWLLFPMEQ